MIRTVGRVAKAYERIAGDLRRRILMGELGPGDRLPAESGLVERYGRSLPTVRQALGLLQAEGLIEKQHGRGNFVRRPRTPVQRSNLRHQWEKDRVRDQAGAAEQSDVVLDAAYREVEAEPDIAEVFDVAVGTAMLERRYRTRYRDESFPFALVRSYVVRDLVAANPDLLDASNEPWAGGTQRQLFTLGIELDRVEERFAARPPMADEAEELGLAPGTAVIILLKTSYDTEGRVVEHSEVTLPGDRTELLFTTQLEKW